MNYLGLPFVLMALFLFGATPFSSASISVGIDYANDRSNSKTKTLGTIGNGTIEVGNVEKSNTKLLNRDINDNEVDIYNIESHQGLKGTVDTRVFTEDGRNAIAEDFERTERLGQAIGDVASKDAFELKDTFAHIDETQKNLDVQKAFALANDGKNIEALQGEGSTVEEKQAAIKLYAEIYAKTYGIDIESANVIATSKVISGSHYGKDGKSTIDINDNAQRNATDYANTMGHEVAHARISQDKVRDRKSEKLNEEYADTMGGYSADGMAFSSETYNNVNLDQNADSNTHVRTAKDQTLLAKNNKNWRDNVQRARNGDGKIDYRELYKREAQMLDQAKEQINGKNNLTPEQKQLMNLQLNAAACAKIKCAEGVPKDDAQYNQLTQLQAIGDSLQAKGLTIEKMLGGALPEDTFDYGFTDKVQDTVTKYDEVVQRGKGAVNAGLGTAGTVVAGAATVATAPLCTTGIGCLAPAGTAVLTGLAAAQAVDGASTLFGDYTSEEGQRVLDSFTEGTHQGDRNLFVDAAVDTALWAGEVVVINKVAKLIPDSMKDDVRDLLTGKKKQDVLDPPLTNPSGSTTDMANAARNQPYPEVDVSSLPRVDVKKMPGELKHTASSGVVLKANPDKTTTVLGSYGKDMEGVISEIKYPKTVDFDAKQGGFNVLNTPNSLYKTPDQFWNQYNKPFLDKAIQRGDDIVLATNPTKKVLINLDTGKPTGFGREYNYLKKNGYHFDLKSKRMVRGNP